MKARRYGIWASLAIVAAITSGALLAQAPQAIGTWVSIGDLSSPLTNGASVALPDKRTLIAGGALADGTLTDAVTIYDSVDDSAAAAGTLTSARADHTATLLKDGRVLVVGGMTADGLVSSDIEIFDPATGTSAIVALLPEPRNGHVAAALPNGNVLIAGGATVDGAILQTAVLFDPETSGVFSVPGHLHIARVHASATTMLDGRVLVAGGSNGTTELASAEIYDRYSQSFSMAATQMSVGRQGHSAVLLPDNGGVLVAGGTSNGVAQAGVDVFLPAVFPDPFSYGEGEFASTGAMTAARTGAVAGPTSVEGYAFAAAGGSPDAEVYRFATIKTNKDDYAPGELATITGSGWQPNEEVTLLFQEDPAVHDDYVLKVNADGSGNIFWNQWAPEHHDIGVRFYLTATDSRSRAQITFTDAPKIDSVTIGTQTGTLTAGTAGAVSYTLTVIRGNSQAEVNADLSVTAGLPSGVTPSFSPNLVSVPSKQNSPPVTLTLQSTALVPAGTYSFTVRAAAGSDYGEGVGTLTIGQSTQSPTTTTVTCPPSVTFSGAAQTPCTAVATGAGGFNQALTVSYTANVTAGTVTASASFAGDTNHVNSSGSATFEILKASSTTEVTCQTVTYDGSAKTPCTATATGAGGLNQSLTVSYSANTDAGMVTASAAFTGDANHASSSGSATFEILKASSTTGVACPATVIYDGSAKTPCTATATGAGGLNQSLTVSYSANTDAGMVTASAAFTGDANHANSSGSATFEILKASSTTGVTCLATVIYDGSAKTPCTATATGAGLNQSLTVSYSANVDAGTVTASATFAGDANHANSSGSASFEILKASSTTEVTCPASVTYDGTAQAPCTAKVTGVAGLDQELSVTYADNTNAGIATASASYPGDSNHADSFDNASFEILKASSTTDVTCPASVTYDGTAQAPCTAKVTGVAGLDQELSVTYADNTNAGIATASASYPGDPNHADSSDSASFEILKASSTTDVTCPMNVTYYGSAQTPCSAVATGVGGLNASVAIEYENNTNAGTAGATATFDGDANHDGSSDSASFTIDKASSTTTISCPVSMTYTGAAQTPCTVTVEGAGGLNETMAGNYSDNINAGTATVSFTYAGDLNHTGSLDSATFFINKANAVVTVNGYAGPYDGHAHGATGTAVGVMGEPLAGLTLGSSFDGVPGGTADWSFTDQTGNYNDQSGDVAIVITKADPTVSVSGYGGVYNGQPHGATGTAKGVLGESLAGLVLGATFTNVPGGMAHWAFTDVTGNYNNKSGDVEIEIYKANATCSITGYDVIFDNASHTATGSCTGVNNSSLAGLNVSGTSHKDAGVYTDAWTFTDVTGNYNNTSGTVGDRIGHWTTDGFYQPVDMNNGMIVWNTVKGGSTVPLKFNLSAGAQKKTSVADVKNFAVFPMSCFASSFDSAIDLTTTGGTALKYDGTGGQFIQNWQTPKTPGQCYMVRLTALDNSVIDAYFKTK